MIEILRGIRVIKIFQAEDTQTRLSVEKGEAFYDNVIEQVKVQKLTRRGERIALRPAYRRR